MWEVINNAKVVQCCDSSKRIGIVVNGEVYELGSGSATKLSDLENDLFYSKRESFLKLTPADFVMNDAMGVYMYDSGQPALDWLTGTDKLGYCLIASPNGATQTVTENEVPVIDGAGMGLPAEMASTVFVVCETAMICNGYPELGPNFAVALHPVSMAMVESIELFKVDVKKIPIEYCDTSEIETEIDEINGEVI